MDFNFLIKTKVNAGALEDLKNYIRKTRKNKQLLLVLSSSMEERFQLSEFIKELQDKNVVNRIKSVPSNPTEIDIKESLEHLEEDFNYVIAFGGGSAIDLAKAVMALQYLRAQKLEGDTILKAIETKDYMEKERVCDFLAIPTTAGTGSEVTSWATVWKSDRLGKLSVDAPWLAPTCAFVVPELTVPMNNRLTIATGLDALSHATESYWSKKSNPIVRELSKTAIKTIVKYLPKVIDDKDNLYYREKMCIGSVFAGLAFANTRTTACHSISYPLTMKYGIEHGFAVAITLVEVMKYNQSRIVEFNELLEAFGAVTPEDIKEWMDIVSNEIQPLTLSSFNIRREGLEAIACQSFTAGRMDNNPVKMKMDDVMRILEKCL
ncbi:MAG: hypothetical protein K0R00_548 [Herbinix sp.]|jgi:alcohol dehydrogenase class IV|nr:hypothetical protein [Herbinix sp.]